MANSLDAIQREISKHNQGPLLVVSGPGSGKTRVITARAAHLVQKVGVSPERMIIVTFTKAAAEEMKSRITRAVGERVAGRMHVQTIHSLAFKFLAGLGKTLRIQDEREQRIRISGIVDQLELPKELVDTYLQERSNALNRIIPLESYQPLNMKSDQFQEITRYYEEQRLTDGFMDFDDLLLEMYAALQKVAKLRGRYIMVDEFQDTSLLQYEILKLLAAPTNNFFAVGDDDQSIYSWRGACNIPLQFAEDFPEAKRVALTVNYRSTQRIVALSAALIEENKNRFKKDLVACSRSSQGTRPEFVAPKDEKDEAIRIIKILESAHQTGLAWQEMAVLYRVNSQGVLFQDELIKRKIPYQILGGESQVLNHSVTKGLLSYLEAALDPWRGDAFFYILNRPGRFISKAFVLEALNLTAQGIGPKEALRQQPLSEASVKALVRLELDLKQIAALNARQALEYVRKTVGLDDYLKTIAKTYSLDWEEYQQIADTICMLPDPGESVETFVQRFSRLTKASLRTYNNSGVTLATCHSAKGLEFKLVSLVGAVEGTLPHEKAELEEERRLAYVAITRSEDRLIVSSPKTMRGKRVNSSRFAQEMRSGLLKEQLVQGGTFEHPVWGRCTLGSMKSGVVLVKKPNGEEAKVLLDWLMENIM